MDLQARAHRRTILTLRTIEVGPKTLWSVAGIVALLALSWLIVSRATSELVIVFLSIVVAEGLRPLVVLLERRRVPQLVAILLVVATVILILGALIWLIITPLLAQLAAVINDAPGLWKRIQEIATTFEANLRNNAQAEAILQQIPARVATFVESKASLLISTPLALASAIFDVILVLLLVIFWLAVSRELSGFVLSFFRANRRDEGRALLDDLSAKIGGYTRGVAINMSVIGVISGIGDHFLGVPYPLLLGVVAGLTESIPIAGPFLGGAAAVLVALATIGWQKAISVAILYLVIQQIEGNTLVPLVMNKAVDLTPFSIMIALIIGAALLGIPGAILSLPAAAAIKVIVVRIAAPAARRALGAET